MKKNKYIILLTVILAVISVILILNNSKSTIKADFTVEDVSTITKIFMSDKLNNSITLSKIDDQNWLLNNKYPARTDGIEMLLETFSQMKVREPVSIAGRNNVIKWLAASSVKVEIYQQKYRINLFNKIKLFPHEKLTKVFYVGGETQDNRGTFMLIEGSSEPFVVYIPGFRGFLSPRFNARETEWRKHTIFDLKIAEISSVRVEYPNAQDSSFEITRNNKIFEVKKLKDNKLIVPYDTMKVLDYMSGFTNINFEAFRNNMGKKVIDSITSQTPMAIITVKDISGKANKIYTYPKLAEPGSIDEFTGKELIFDRDRFYGLVNEGKDFVLLQYFVFDAILRTSGYFKQNVNKKN
jgi:hypothetical protein